MSSFEICIAAPAFMNNDVNKMTRVPATNNETLEAKYVLVQFDLYILKMRRTYFVVNYLN